MSFIRSSLKLFSVIAGNKRWLPLATLVQTDGSFLASTKLSKTAVYLPLTKEGHVESYFEHSDSMESEWQSVLDGLEHDLPLITLENDNLGVISSLILRKPPRKYKDYYYEILESAKLTELFAVRWIPREYNAADKLFRSNCPLKLDDYKTTY